MAHLDFAWRGVKPPRISPDLARAMRKGLPIAVQTLGEIGIRDDDPVIRLDDGTLISRKQARARRAAAKSREREFNYWLERCRRAGCIPSSLGPKYCALLAEALALNAPVVAPSVFHVKFNRAGA